jgi:hypothetical protein
MTTTASLTPTPASAARQPPSEPRRFWDRLQGTYLNPDERIFLSELITQYEILDSKTDNPGAERVCQRIMADFSMDRASLTWRDVYAFQTALLALKPIEIVRQELPQLRATYAEIVNVREYAAYASSRPPDPATAPKEIVRADATFLLAEVQRYRTFVSLRERHRNSIVWRSAVCMLATIAAITGLYMAMRMHYSGTAHGTYIEVSAAAAAFAGAIGGYISLQQRLQTAYSDGDPVSNVIQLRFGVWPLYIAPLTGAVFAVVLFFVFCGELVSGSLFPQMGPETIPVTTLPQKARTVSPPSVRPATAAPMVGTAAPNGLGGTGASAPAVSASSGENGGEVPTSAADAATQAVAAAHSPVTPPYEDILTDGPTKAVDFAKLLVWCFIAGFAERFVPDVLNRLVGQANANDAKPALPASGNTGGVSPLPAVRRRRARRNVLPRGATTSTAAGGSAAPGTAVGTKSAS